MAIIKSVRQRLMETERDNARLRTQAAKQQELLEFLGILNDVDIEELMEEEADDDGDE